MSLARMKATGRVNNPTRMRRPPTTSIIPWTPKKPEPEPTRSGAVPLFVGSAEDDVEGAGESIRLGRGDGPQGHDQAGAGSRIAHAHQHTVTVVAGLAGDVHLGDEARQAAGGDREMDVRGAAGIGHRPDRAEMVAAGLVG